MALQSDIAAVPFGNVLTELARNERRRAVRRKLIDFRREQRVHMPGLEQIIQFEANGAIVDDNREPEHIPLCLPSDVRLEGHRGEVCNDDLVQLEGRLRVSQAEEALDNLRHQLHVRTFANKFKVKNMVGQRENARGRQWQATIDRRATAAAKRY